MWIRVFFPLGLFMVLLEPVRNTVIYPHLQWDPRNSFFKGGRSLSVEPMSRINIVCPSPALISARLFNTIPKEQLYENIWIVDKASYDACAVDTSIKTNRLVKKCDNPLNINYYTIVFQQFSATPNGLEFTPGTEYYFIATSDGTELSLTKTSGGHCASHSMKMEVYVCVDANDARCQDNSPTTATPQECPTTAAQPPVSQCADSNTLISIYNNTKNLAGISNQTSMIPGLVSILQSLQTKLITMESKLDNCTSSCIPVPTPAPILESCAAYYSSGSRTNGAYKINPGGLGTFEVYCDQTTDGGGWAVFQKRFNGQLDFSSKGWTDYVNGFGNLLGEFWLGLDHIHRIASSPVKLRVDLGAPDGEERYALYQGFSVANKNNKYKLTSGTYSGGNAGDSLSFSNNANFSTFDQDNDKWADQSCAAFFKGAWWHNICHESSLNGVYRNGSHSQHFADGVIWKSWKGYTYSLSKTEMKVKA